MKAGSVVAAKLADAAAKGSGEMAAREQARRFERGGFDGIVGNPPFLGGQKLTGSMGMAYRNYLVQCLGWGGTW